MVAHCNHDLGSAAMITAYFAFTVIAYFTAVIVHVADGVVGSDSGR
jgi:hypothetical protein